MPLDRRRAGDDRERRDLQRIRRRADDELPAGLEPGEAGRHGVGDTQRWPDGTAVLGPATAGEVPAGLDRLADWGKGEVLFLRTRPISWLIRSFIPRAASATLGDPGRHRPAFSSPH